MPFHDAFTDGQSHPYPLILARPIQTMKRLENAIDILHIEPNPIVFYLYFYSCLLVKFDLFAGHSDGGWFIRQVIFQSVTEEVDKQSFHLAGIGHQGGKLANFYSSTEPVNGD